MGPATCWHKRGIRPGDHEGELTEAPTLLARLPLAGRVVTGDALYCQRSLCQQIRDAGGDYVVIVKDNYPTLRADIRTLFATPPPSAQFAIAEQTSRHGGRLEVRRLTVSAALAGYLDWPGVGLVGEAVGTVTHNQRTTTQTRTVLTSLPPDTDVAQILQWVRGHWRIDNRLHYVRDVTMNEDRSRWRAGAAPQVVAALRNVVLTLLRAVKVPNIAAARRTLARQRAALRLLGWRAPG
jgi:predicted transposase YbfD/YdcC